MKNAIKISLLMVLALVFLTACQEGTKMTAPEALTPVSAEAFQTADAKGAVYGDQEDLSVPSEMLVQPGHIFVANDSRNLYVSYYLNDSWQLAGANLNVVKTTGGAISDVLGLPLTEKFRYKATLSDCETVYTQVIPLNDLNLRPGDDFLLVSQALVDEKNPLDNLDQPYNICVPGNGDQQWWQRGMGRVKTDPNAPDRMLKITLQELPGQIRPL